MTLAFGQKLLQGIILIADSRTTWLNDKYEICALQDNAQKIFRLTDDIFIAFSGDFYFANRLILFLLSRINTDKKLKNLNYLCIKAPKILNYAYNFLSKEKKEDPPLSIMIGGVDFKRPKRNNHGEISGIAMFENRLLKIKFRPSLIIEEATYSNPILIMGSGEPAIEKNENDFKAMQFNIGAYIDIKFHAFLMSVSLKEEIKKLGIETVGGLFQIATIDLNNSGLFPYKTSRDLSSGKMDVELIISKDNTHLIQKDLKTGEEIPLLLPYEISKEIRNGTKLFAYTKLTSTEF